MGALTTSTVVPPGLETFYSRALLHRALPYLHHGRMLDRRPLEQRNGNTMKMRRYESLAISTAPLVEGQPPTGVQLTYTDIEVQLQQWGNVVPLTDVVQMTHQDKILNEANKLLGENSGQVIDRLNREELNAGTVVQYGGSASGRATLQTTAHVISTGDLDIAIRTLENANAAFFNEVIKASVNIGTTPVAPTYWGILSPSVHMTAKGMTGWQDVWQYSNTGPVLPGEVGAYRNIRFLQTTSAKVVLGGGGAATGVQATGGNADVHCVMIMGQHFAASVPMSGASLKNIIKPRGSAGTADPLDQIGTSGWIHFGARKRTNEAFAVRLEVTAIS